MADGSSSGIGLIGFSVRLAESDTLRLIRPLNIGARTSGESARSARQRGAVNLAGEGAVLLGCFFSGVGAPWKTFFAELRRRLRGGAPSSTMLKCWLMFTS